jgi:2-polyprenyl-3-methyl-5-hydroxy-6-metoxy-1,4-benzoquinol methylase
MRKWAESRKQQGIMAPNPDHGPPGDDERLAAFALHVWRYKQGEVVSLMIHLGERLGLYRAMAGHGPMTAAGLAARTQLHERWLQEWLRGQAAAGLVDTADGEVFELSPEGSAVLADEDGSLWFAAGAFLGGIAPPEVVDRVADAFRTGRGLSFDERGPSGAHDAERSLAPWTRLALVQRVLPVLDGVRARLEAGARVVDVGCGAGVALVAMATAFPNSTFEGFDPSQQAVDLARARISETGLTNVSLHLASATDLPDRPSFDLVLTLDCIHDMPNPAAAMVAIRRAIRPDGTWLIKDIRAAATWSDNQRNPMLAMMYGMSVVACMSSGLSEPGGAGLGTLGFHPGLAEAMCREAGFTRFVVHDFDDPSNLYYEVRP